MAKRKPRVVNDTNRSPFDGITWQPMTVQRQQLVCDLGLRIEFTTDDYRTQDTFHDTILWLWVASLTPDAVDRFELEMERRDKRRARRESKEWAARNGIFLGSQAFRIGYKLFSEQYQEIRASRGEPVMPHGTEGPDDSEC